MYVCNLVANIFLVSVLSSRTYRSSFIFLLSMIIWTVILKVWLVEYLHLGVRLADWTVGMTPFLLIMVITVSDECLWQRNRVQPIALSVVLLRDIVWKL